MPNRVRLLELLPRLEGRRILVVGDLFWDDYIVGAALGLSREAPVPVLEFRRRLGLPGAAANPANNIQALGGRALLVGVVGDDEAGQQLAAALCGRGIDTAGLVVDPSRPTIIKTRIVAEDGTRARQQMVRVDRLDRSALCADIKAALLCQLEATLPQAEAVLLSDYKAGVVSEELVDATLGLARRDGKIVTVDSQGDLHKFRGCTLVKCNQQEAEAALSRHLTDEATFREATRYLLNKLGAQAVVITRGAQGMSLAEPGRYRYIPAHNPSEVYDVTGAGDTVIAVLTLALAAGARLEDAAHLADLAAGLVVRRPGNATVSPTELREALRRDARLAKTRPAPHQAQIDASP